ncbi:hypothetical protein ACFSJ3_08675 [Corallincola platygyrae]|uniref:Uncharacterized protein n=1 Tax=Corallincola platygyrae TaxID=1193278 RepID=A0ABW4XNL0_9GAMM
MRSQFRAINADNGQAVEVEIFADNHRHGYTPTEGNSYLTLEGSGHWFAMLGNRRVAQGELADGQFELIFSEGREPHINFHK